MRRDVHCSFVPNTEKLNTSCLSIQNQLILLWSHATIKGCCGSSFLNIVRYIHVSNERMEECKCSIWLLPLCLIWKPVKAGLALFPCHVTFCLMLLDNCFVSGSLCTRTLRILAPLFPLGSRSRWPLITAEFNWGTVNKRPCYQHSLILSCRLILPPSYKQKQCVWPIKKLLN